MATYKHTHNPEVHAAIINAAAQLVTNHQTDTEEAVLRRFANAYMTILKIVDDPEAAMDDLSERGNWELK